MATNDDLIFGKTWEDIQAMERYKAALQATREHYALNEAAKLEFLAGVLGTEKRLAIMAEHKHLHDLADLAEAELLDAEK